MSYKEEFDYLKDKMSLEVDAQAVKAKEAFIDRHGKELYWEVLDWPFRYNSETAKLLWSVYKKDGLQATNDLKARLDRSIENLKLLYNEY